MNKKFNRKAARFILTAWNAWNAHWFRQISKWLDPLRTLIYSCLVKQIVNIWTKHERENTIIIQQNKTKVFILSFLRTTCLCLCDLCWRSSGSSHCSIATVLVKRSAQVRVFTYQYGLSESSSVYSTITYFISDGNVTLCYVKKLWWIVFVRYFFAPNPCILNADELVSHEKTVKIKN